MDDNEVSAELRLCWLVDAPFHKVKAFWEAMAATSNRTGKNSSCVKRAFHPTYKRMKKRGWINIGNLEKKHSNMSLDARSILYRVRAHPISSIPTNDRNGNAPDPPSLQMVLNPYSFQVSNNSLNSFPWVNSEAVPVCVPYVVLKEFNLVFNRLPVDQDYFSRNHIASLTEQSLRFLNYIYPSPPVRNGNNLLDGSIPLSPDNINRPPDAVDTVLPDNIISVDDTNIASHLLDTDAECVICVETILPAEQNYVILHCLHSFHDECLEKWKDQKKFEATCPICRGSVFPLIHHRQQ